MVKKRIKTISILMFIFILSSMGAMVIIKKSLEHQMPYDFDQLLEMHQDQIYELKFLGIKLQTVKIEFEDNSSVTLKYENHKAHYGLPFVLAGIFTALISISAAFVEKKGKEMNI